MILIVARLVMLPDEIIAVDAVPSPTLPERLAVLTKATVVVVAAGVFVVDGGEEVTVAVVRATRGSVAFIGS